RGRVSWLLGEALPILFDRGELRSVGGGLLRRGLELDVDRLVLAAAEDEERDLVADRELLDRVGEGVRRRDRRAGDGEDEVARVLVTLELRAVGRAVGVDGEDAHALRDGVRVRDTLDAEPRRRHDGSRGHGLEEALDGRERDAERDRGAGLVLLCRGGAAAG